MPDRFRHYLSYGAQDQVTMRELAALVDGAVVPGTIAAFQRDGTGGFLLTLSASKPGFSYLIDPRFPLFQQALPSPKKSHVMLADLLGDSELVATVPPQPQEFTSSRAERLGAHWADFNTRYSTTTRSKFEKYAEVLGESLDADQGRGPSVVVGLYVIADGPTDPWWRVSEDLFRATERHTGSVPCWRVVAATSARALGSLLAEVKQEQIIVWVSGLDELTTSAKELTEYGMAIRQAVSRGQKPLALYGGFFSVLLAAVGLAGASHGIGYGEQRAWLELPSSGPAPSRYYLPLAHRYVQQDFAQELWLADRQLTQCSCAECAGASPLELGYHALMKHSVRCRISEIDGWGGMSLDEIGARLGDETGRFLAGLAGATLSEHTRRRADEMVAHLPRWIASLRGLAGGTPPTS